MSAVKVMAGAMVLALAVLCVTSYAGEAEFRQDCASRLSGESLLIVIEKAIQRDVIKARRIADFALSPDWYNPFDKADASLLSARFRTAFATLSRGMGESERVEFKVALKRLLAKLKALDEVAEANSAATASTFVFTSLPGMPALGLTSAGTGFAFAFENGRPVYAKHMTDGFKAWVVLFDPFEEGSRRTVQLEGLSKRSDDDIPTFTHYNSKTYLVHRLGSALDLGTGEYSQFDLPKENWGSFNPVTVSTPEGEALVYHEPPRLHRIGKGSEPLVPGVDGDYPVSVNRVGDRDIVNAPVGDSLAFRDLSGKEDLKSFPGRNMLLYRTAVFEEGGKLLAAIPFMSKRSDSKTGIVIWDLRKGEELRRLETPGGDKVHVIRDSGRTFVVYTRDGQAGGYVPLEGGDVTRLPLLPKTGIVPMHALGRDFIAWAKDNRLYVYDLVSGSMMNAVIPGLGRAGMMKIFERDGLTYAVIDDQTGFPVLVQVTGSTR